MIWFKKAMWRNKINDQYVGVYENQLMLGSIPNNKELENSAGKSILTGFKGFSQKLVIKSTPQNLSLRQIFLVGYS